MKRFTILAWLVALGLIPTVWAYEPPTHAEMSARAAARSVLGKGDVLKDIGAGSLTSPTYNNSSIADWIRFGAIEEDSGGCRSLNHFYNPLNGSGLAVPGLASLRCGREIGVPSPLWGLEDPGSIPGQQFSFRDARDYYLQGLTRPSKADRDTGLALTFRTMGQVIHLIQDAAQPQHTRNDAHFPYSIYERMTDALRAKNALPYDGYPSADTVVVFNNARSFWNTLPPPINPRTHVMDGQGMAEYSNRGFVTTGTNYLLTSGGNPIAAVAPSNFPLPAFNPSSRLTMDVTEVQAAFPECTEGPLPSLHGGIVFYGNEVSDTYQPASSAFNLFGTSLSIYSPELGRTKLGNGTPAFRLNHFNYCAAHQFLIPRAVGYSAGLIDYFFRGKIDYVPDPSVPGNFLLKNLGPEDINGRFALYYDTQDGTRKPVLDRSGVPVVWQTPTPLAASTGQMSVTPNFDSPADAKSANTYMLVFNGDMGEERQDPANDVIGTVVGKLVQQSSPELAMLLDFSETVNGQENLVIFDTSGAASAYLTNLGGIPSDSFVPVFGFPFVKDGLMFKIRSTPTPLIFAYRVTDGSLVGTYNPPVPMPPYIFNFPLIVLWDDIDPGTLIFGWYNNDLTSDNGTASLYRTDTTFSFATPIASTNFLPNRFGDVSNWQRIGHFIVGAALGKFHVFDLNANTLSTRDMNIAGASFDQFWSCGPQYVISVAVDQHTNEYILAVFNPAGDLLRTIRTGLVDTNVVIFNMAETDNSIVLAVQVFDNDSGLNTSSFFRYYSKSDFRTFVDRDTTAAISPIVANPGTDGTSGGYLILPARHF